MNSPNSVNTFELRADKLSYEINDKLILEGVSFTVKSGEMLFIEGSNGSGKTTLLRILSGLMQADEGQVCWNGKNIEDERIEYNQQLSYLGHSTGVKAELSTLENINFFSALSGLPQKENSQAAIKWVGLEDYEHSPCRHLSYGQQRRIALTRLLMEPSQIWILDEPFAGLDKKMISALEFQFKNHIDNGGLLILTSHQHIEFDQANTMRLHLG
ncbi:MAG: cytochrome c biogenesis ATP-binding export protein CcmA [marine bacterium B5-7]|nr:MAG: cytochrome c biogenesis ATP-binding export protein CcmA [marine bacterium B5-7]